MDEHFSPNEQFYRGLHSIWLEDDNSVSSAAFKDSNGISVDRDGGRAEQDCISRLADNLPQLEGIGRLSYEDIKECGALPVYLPVENNDYHSEIHDSVDQVQIKSKSKSKKLASKCQVVFRKH